MRSSAAVFERYSEEARGVVVMAQEEARALRHNYIGTEHLLLAVLRLPRETVVGRVLAELEVSSDSVRTRLLALVPKGEDPSQAQLPFTPRCKRAFEVSLREALSRGGREIGPEHILLGLVGGDGEDVAIRLLRDQEITPEQVRAAVLGALPPADHVESRSMPRRLVAAARHSTVSHLPIEVDLSSEAQRLLMSAGARALDDGRLLIEIADIEEALRRRDDAGDPPPQTATG